MKNRKIISLLVLTSLGLASCADFFEREPFSQVGADAFFRSEKNVVLFVNGLLQKNMPGSSALLLFIQAIIRRKNPFNALTVRVITETIKKPTAAAAMLIIISSEL